MDMQKGSAHVIVTLVLAVALVGTLGFVFWQNFIKKDEPVKQNETTKTETKEEEKTEELAKATKLEIKEFNKSLDLTDAKYDDITYSMTSIDRGASKYVAAIYSKDLNRRLVADANETNADEYTRLGCNKAVYVFYGVYDEIAGMYGPIGDPSNPPANSTLQVGYIGPCSPSTQALGDEIVAFREYVEANLQ